MKKLLILLVAIIVFLISGRPNYIEYQEGTFPILITSSHGGSIYKGIKKRDCKNNVCSKDLFTKEITKELYENLKEESFNCSYVISNLHRKVLDCNREPEVAYAGNTAKINYFNFHGKIEKFINNNLYKDSVILIVDIHGHTHSHNKIELGYDVPGSVLNSDTLYKVSNSSLENLHFNVDLIHKLGNLYDIYDMSAVPNSYVKTPSKYFNGGFITEKYKSYPNTVVVQIEIPAKIRKNSELRKDFSKKTAKIIKYYYNIINNSLNHEKI